MWADLIKLAKNNHYIPKLPNLNSGMYQWNMKHIVYLYLDTKINIYIYICVFSHNMMSSQYSQTPKQ